MPPSRRLARDDGQRLWRSLEELPARLNIAAFLHNEFPNDPDKEPETPRNGFNRRDILKLMAASAALSGLTGCTKLPTEKIVPYVRAPEEIIPGKPLFYATSMTDRGVAIGLLVESHMGRPTKVEGNPEHPGSLGASDIFCTGFGAYAVRPGPLAGGACTKGASAIGPHSWPRWTSFATNLSEHEGRRAADSDGDHVVAHLRGADANAARSNSRRRNGMQHEPCGEIAAREGARLAFGRQCEFGLSIRSGRRDRFAGCDFSPGRRGERAIRAGFHDVARTGDARASQMNRLYVVESTPTNTGAMADHRLADSLRRNRRISRAALAAALGRSPVQARSDSIFPD